MFPLRLSKKQHQHSAMNNPDEEKQAVRVKIAEICGWKMHDHPDCLELKKGWISRDWETWVLSPDGQLEMRHDIPDYTASLDAMASAEAILPRDVLVGDYKTNLLDITFENSETRKPMFVATALQRARAFVRTMEKETK